MHFSQRIRDIELPPFDRLNTRAAQLRAAGYDVISLGQALPPFGPPPSVLNACRDALADSETHVYSADAGRLSLRTILAMRLAETMGIDCSPDEIIVTAGGNQAFMLAVMTLVEPGDDVLLPAPYFVNHEMALRAVGAIPVEVPLSEETRFSTRWSDIEPHLTPRTRAVVLCNPSNPTGATIDAAEGGRIVHELARRSILVLSDETYAHFVYEGTHWSAASVAGWRENVVVVNTFSKSFGMTGWRIGYMVADSVICQQALKIQDAMIICAPVISQIAAEHAVRESWDYPVSFHRELKERRNLLAERLKDIKRLRWRPTNGAFFAFVHVDGCEDSATLANDILEEAHVVVIPGTVFGRGGEGHIRMSYGSVDRPALERALARVSALFDLT